MEPKERHKISFQVERARRGENRAYDGLEDVETCIGVREALQKSIVSEELSLGKPRFYWNCSLMEHSNISDFIYGQITHKQFWRNLTIQFGNCCKIYNGYKHSNLSITDVD